MLRRLIAVPALLGLFLTAACSSELSSLRKDPSSLAPAERLAAEQVQNAPSVVRVKIPQDAFAVHDLPAIGGDRQVNVEFNRTPAEDVFLALSRVIGVNIITDVDAAEPGAGADNNRPAAAGQPAAPTGRAAGAPSGSGSTGSSGNAGSNKKKLVSLKFNGKCSELFAALSSLTGYIFVQEGNIIVVKSQETFSAVVPNFPDLLKEINASLTTLGAEDVSYDGLTSTLSFKANYPAYVKTRAYLAQLRNNASLVTMRIVLVNVGIDNAKNMGIDWTKFSYGFGSLKTSQNSGSSDSNDGNTPAGEAGAAEGDSTTTSFSEGYQALIGGGGLSFLVDNVKFSFAGMFNFLESYGRFKVMQNIFIETLSGKQGKIEVLTETPYVSSVSIGALSSGSTTTAQSASTTTARNGVEVTVLPQYNRAANTLGVNLKVGVYGVTRYITLSAGSQLGSLTQPETTTKSVETYLRMTPEQVAIIGGLVFEQDGDDVSGLPFDSYLAKARTKNGSRQELVIIVKPTIVEFVD